MSSEVILSIFDTHAHLYLEQFNVDREMIVSRLGQVQKVENHLVEMSGVLFPGIDLQSSRRSIEIASMSSKFHAAVGIHPNSDIDSAFSDWIGVEELASGDGVIAIGETGLDRYRDVTPIDLQEKLFCRHIELAIGTKKPILIHCRDAWDDMLPILRRYDGLTGVIHSFNGTDAVAREVLDRGFYVSFSGQVTYRNKKFTELHDVAKIIPSERLLIETDSPYLIPHPLRDKLKRNEPTYAVLVALRLAELRNESPEYIAKITTQNAKKIFGLKE
jgi:TatD DNase family protein